MPHGSHLLGVMGNHDAWFFTKYREMMSGTSESSLADYMEWMLDEFGILQFSAGRENYIELSPALVWWHGQFVSKNSSANAKNTLAQFTKDGISRSVVVGHTHRPALVNGVEVGYPGVTFVNSPCLSRVENVPYIKRDPQGWGLGITLCYFVPGTRLHRLELVVYREEGTNLVAYTNGRVYKTKIDKEVPADF